MMSLWIASNRLAHCNSISTLGCSFTLKTNEDRVVSDSEVSGVTQQTFDYAPVSSPLQTDVAHLWKFPRMLVSRRWLPLQHLARHPPWFTNRYWSPWPPLVHREPGHCLGNRWSPMDAIENVTLIRLERWCDGCAGESEEEGKWCFSTLDSSAQEPGSQTLPDPSDHQDTEVRTAQPGLCAAHTSVY